MEEQKLKSRDISEGEQGERGLNRQKDIIKKQRHN